jgi:L-prolyl-PCP dehydrogenase
MEFELSQEQEQLYSGMKEFGAKILSPGASQRDKDQVFSRELWKKAADFGVQGLPVDPQYGGSGLDPLSMAIALEGLGYGNEDSGLSFALCAHILACTIPLMFFGSEKQKEKFLPGMCDGGLIAVNGMTEPASGSEVFQMQTTARKYNDGYLLNGTKIFATNGPEADLAIVYAKTDDSKGFHGGITAFIVEKGEKGFACGQSFEKMGLRSCTIGELVFEDVYISKENRIGEEGGGGYIFNLSMEWERSVLGAIHIGTMDRVLDQTIQYAKTRKAGENNIGSFQSVSHRIAEMKVMTEASRLLTYKAAWNLNKSRTNALNASIAKYYTSENYKQLADYALQIFGGYGYMTDYKIEKILRDAIASTIYSGTSNIQKNIISRWLGIK